MAIENSASYNFLSTFVDSIDVFDCRLPGVVTHSECGFLGAIRYNTQTTCIILRLKLSS